MPRRAWAGTALSIALVLAVGTGVWFGGAPLLYATGLYVDGGSPTIDPGQYSPTPEPTPSPVSPSPVAATAGRGALPDASTLLQRLLAVDRSSVPRDGMAVVDPVGGTTITGDNATAMVTPASTFKLLTCAAVLDEYGPGHRFTTQVVTGTGDQIVLVGGGDPYLRGATTANYPARASIGDLADATAASLKAANRASVALVYDDSLFTGPAWNPNWLPGYHEFATPTSALWVDEGIVNGVHTTDPSAGAANAFAAQLTARGIQVTSVNPGSATPGATQLAAVRSLPLDLIVQQVLLHSDNDGAEVLFRHVGLGAGMTGSISDAQLALKTELILMGLWADGMTIQDGSGLSRGNLASPTVLALAVAKGLTDPRLRALADGLPTAAADGTLYARYDEVPSEAPARGVVRAKTGTLTGVHSLAGFTTTASGGLVTFAFVANDVPDTQALAARDWLERVTTVVAACGC